MASRFPCTILEKIECAWKIIWQVVCACAALVGGGEALSQKAGIPRRTLETYLTGTADPKGKRLAAICAATGVSGHWLLTGEGERTARPAGASVTERLGLGDARYDNSRPPLAINPGALAVIIEYVWQLGPERSLKERCHFAALQYTQMTAEGHITPFACGTPIKQPGMADRAQTSTIGPVSLASHS